MDRVETGTSWLFRAVLFVCLAAVCVIFAGQIAIVLLRYTMGVGFLELQDLVTYAFGILIVLAVTYAYWNGRHVRVDVLSNRLGPRVARMVDRVGALLFVLPVFVLLLVDAWPLVAASFAILEGSRETGGLGGLFIVKGSLIAMCLLVILVALITVFGGKVGDGD